MQLELTPEEMCWINEKVANGEYESPDALICEALQLLQESEEESELLAAGLMRLPLEEKSDDFLDLPEPQAEMNAIQKVIREEREEE